MVIATEPVAEDAGQVTTELSDVSDLAQGTVGWTPPLTTGTPAQPDYLTPDSCATVAVVMSWATGVWSRGHEPSHHPVPRARAEVAGATFHAPNRDLAAHRPTRQGLSRRAQELLPAQPIGRPHHGRLFEVDTIARESRARVWSTESPIVIDDSSWSDTCQLVAPGRARGLIVQPSPGEADPSVSERGRDTARPACPCPRRTGPNTQPNECPMRPQRHFPGLPAGNRGHNSARHAGARRHSYSVPTSPPAACRAANPNVPQPQPQLTVSAKRSPTT